MSTHKKLKRRGIHTALAALSVMASQPVWAEALNTQLPKQQEESFSVPVNVDIPAQPLANSLHDLGKATGMNISFPNDVVSGKTAPEVRGRMTRKEALQRVLGESGLVPKVEGNNIFIQKPPKEAKKDIQLDKVEVRAKRFYEVGPLPGLGLTKEEIPGNVQSISAKEIKEAHSLSITDLMNRKLQSVTVNDYQGNPFQMDVQYRGFTAGPQIGTPQGLSVFFDGIRVNEPFGDVVNWDMIPMNALASVDVFPGSNPIFGLGTLGGAFSVKTKDGFNNAGTDATILTGSFGRKYLQGEAGWNNGTVALFGAGNFFLEDGWRDNSPSKVNQFFGKASYRGDKLDLNLSTLLVGNDLTGNGVVPTTFYEQDRSSVFTSPDETKNRLSQFQLSGNYFVNDTFTITGQVYRRNSRRSQKNADVYTDYRGQALSQNLNGLEFTCLFDSTGQAAEYGLSDYVVIDVPNANDLSSSPFLNELFNNGNVDLSLLDADAFNQTLTDTPEGSAYLALAQSNLAYWGNAGPLVRANIPAPDIAIADPSGNFNSVQFTGQVFQNEFAVDATGTGFGYNIFGALAHSYFYSNNGNTLHLVAFKQARNGTDCLANQASSALGKYYNPLIGPRGVEMIDGVSNGGAGVVEGIPTAVINNNNINQKVDGASVQFNWNLEKHKFMVGASIDNAYAEYNNSQRLGFFDTRRNGAADPDRALDMFKAADFDIANNNFDGNSITKSLYLSETWTPVESFHMTGALRYNQTQVNTTLAARDFGQSEITLNRYLNDPALFAFCSQNGTCPGTGYTSASPLFFTLPAEHEKFSYYSLNPSLGATWQAKENLNLYANWAQGTRTPSVVELGCAIDKTPTRIGSDPNGNDIFMPRSVALGRSCQLPSGLSGDPYLPQVRAETFDVGARGRWGDSLQWNLGYYRTELKNDIYMVTYFGNQNFFDSIGKTRRQGIEMGLSGEVGKARFGINYALTDAKFRSTFVTGGDANSSATAPILIAGTDTTTSGEITVRPGDRIPGVPLHNLNANFSYDITPDWTVSLGAVLHSWSYLRGNENNEHRPGVPRPVIIPIYDSNGNFQRYDTVYRQPSTNPGKIPGYTVFNFQTSYKLSKEWTATLLVNNIFDKEYFSAGRLGVNPFSPSINGAIGPDGYNHNSGDWLSTNFVAPGAPRGIWFSLNWHFVPDKQ